MLSITQLQLNAAYEVLSEAQKRQEYNVCWPGIRSTRAADQAAEAERKRAEAERAKNQEANARGPAQSASSKARLEAIEAMRKAHEAEKQRYEREIKRQREQLRDLRVEKMMHESKIFKLRRVITRLNEELKRLDEQDEEDGKKDVARNSWWTCLSSSIFRTEIETKEAKLRRDMERLNRQASRTMKLSRVQNTTDELGKETAINELCGRDIEILDSKIRMEYMYNHEREMKKERELEEQREHHRRDEERAAAETRAKEMQERARRAAAEQQKRDAEDAERARRVRTEWQKKREEEAEKERLAEIARKRRQREAEEREKARIADIAKRQRQREVDERERQRIAALTRAAQRRDEQTQARRYDSPHEQPQRISMLDEEVCGHKQYWNKKEGIFLCSKCNMFFNRFVFECSGCPKIACAYCRHKLREKETAGRRRQEDGGRKTGVNLLLDRISGWQCELFCSTVKNISCRCSVDWIATSKTFKLCR